MSQKRGLEEAEEGELSGESKCPKRSASRAQRRQAAEKKGYGEGFAKGYAEGKKAAEATAFEEGSQASKAEVAALKQQLERLKAELEREVLRADNLQHQFDITQLERVVAERAARN